MLRRLSVEELPEIIIKVEMLSNVNMLLRATNLFENHNDMLFPMVLFLQRMVTIFH